MTAEIEPVGDDEWVPRDALGREIALEDFNFPTKEEAKNITAHIRDYLEDATEMLILAWRGKVWEVLGYDSWDAWIDGEFEGIPLALPRASRKAVMVSMKEAGLTTRAIAWAIGVNQATVSRATSQRSADANASSEQDAVHRAAKVILAQPDLTQREVAEKVGCSVGTANKARKIADGVLKDRALEQAERDKPQPPKPAADHMADCDRIIMDLANVERWLKTALKHALELDTVDEDARRAIECYLPSITKMTAAIAEVARSGSLDEQLAKLLEG